MSYPVCILRGMDVSSQEGLADQPVVIDWRGELPPGVDAVARVGDPAVIVLSRRLLGVARRCILVHERVHIERGGGSEHPDPVVRRREERWVDKVAAGRLVPAADFDEWLDSLDDDQPVDVAYVVERWRVTDEFAMLLLEAAVARRRHPAAGHKGER